MVIESRGRSPAIQKSGSGSGDPYDSCRASYRERYRDPLWEALHSPYEHVGKPREDLNLQRTSRGPKAGSDVRRAPSFRIPSAAEASHLMASRLINNVLSRFGIDTLYPVLGPPGLNGRCKCELLQTSSSSVFLILHLFLADSGSQSEQSRAFV